ncbi:MAG: PIN domain-containing protein, partial [Pseudomonadota bacterium]
MSKRLFVVDSNVLMHDPTSLFRFQEHDVFVPMMVLEELDNNKKGRTEVARNARQASRFLDELLSTASHEDIEQGLPLNAQLESLANQKPQNGKQLAEKLNGKLFFQTRAYPDSLPHHLPGNLPDNNILGTALALQENRQDRQVTLVTKDINLRIKAAVVGIHAEDYRNDRVLKDVDLL